jgi:hypothetical protein
MFLGPCNASTLDEHLDVSSHRVGTVHTGVEEKWRVSALSAGANSTALLVMVNRVKG